MAQGAMSPAGAMINRKEYDALVPETDDQPGAARNLSRLRGRTVEDGPPAMLGNRRPLVAAAGLLAAAIVAVALFGSHHNDDDARWGGSALRHQPAVVHHDGGLQLKEEVIRTGRCGPMDLDTDYVLWGKQWGMAFDHIPFPEMCCAMCQGVARCQSWTWVKDAGLDGCPSQCWLKDRRPDEKKAGKKGFVSGVPPPRAPAAQPSTRSGKPGPAPVVQVNITDASAAESVGHKGQICGQMEHDTDYQSGQLLAPVEDVRTVEQCCKTCASSVQCKAWTWGKFKSSDEQNSVCYMKTEVPKDASEKKRAEGVVSGLPGDRIVRKKLNYDMQSISVFRPGSIFCFSLMIPGSYEQELLKAQHDMSSNIFGCDEAAVYSNTSITIAPGVITAVIDSDLQCKLGGESYTALNSWIFIAVWRRVVEDARYLHHDWTVKVDPDSVFLPDRLGVVLQDHKGAGYLNNCKFGLHGPIEVLARSAVAALAADYDASFDGKAPKLCVETLEFGLWGEDVFLDRCLHDVLQVGRETDDRLMCEAHCDCPDWFWCKNGTNRVSFHPFKRADLYTQCLANTLEDTKKSQVLFHK
mmetsp:Transcript_6353/g.17761  ORF Transcript_6353/g.17761 Transcript_6353/m.17761 type:complete len:581 (-) Transcript_6353:104-1846(-)